MVYMSSYVCKLKEVQRKAEAVTIVPLLVDHKQIKKKKYKKYNIMLTSLLTLAIPSLSVSLLIR